LHVLHLFTFLLYPLYLVSFSLYVVNRALPSFPTRRSSDLNSSLVERLCAENLTGLNLTPKLRQRRKMLGRGALYTRRNSSASGCGVYRSENAGMSSANAVRICMAESLRFLEEGSSAPS